MPLTGSYTGIGVAPRLTAALALSTDRVRLTFNEAMAPNAALSDPASYTITPAVGSAARTVTAVVLGEGTNPTQVVLVLDGALTLGTGNYSVTALNPDGLTDVAENDLDPLYDTATFSGLYLAADVSEVNSDGGEIVSFQLGLDDGDYYVDVGLDPEVEAVRAYSARPGFESLCESVDGLLTFTVPRLTPAEDYRALVTPAEAGFPIVTSPLFHARRRPIFTATHTFRESLQPKWDRGARDFESEEVA